MDEFRIIETYFLPLAKGRKEALGLKDDAAILQIPEGYELVVTTDTIQEGIHFIGNESPALIAQKLLRVNLSDLAAKGATPYCYFLNLGLPSHCGQNWIANFAKGLAKDQEIYDLFLAGGDSTNTKSKISLSITMMGLTPKGKMITRAGAKPGDELYVTGTIGDGYLGLQVAKEKAAYDAYLLKRYQLPEPRLRLANYGLPITSCIDISDGLLQDAHHLAEASLCQLNIDTQKIPFSEATKHWLAQYPEKLANLLNGGDDYELLFTLPKDYILNEKIQKTAYITKIGRLSEGKKQVILSQENKETILSTGYRHHF